MAKLGLLFVAVFCVVQVSFYKRSDVFKIKSFKVNLNFLLNQFNQRNLGLSTHTSTKFFDKRFEMCMEIGICVN